MNVNPHMWCEAPGADRAAGGARLFSLAACEMMFRVRVARVRLRGSSLRITLKAPQRLSRQTEGSIESGDASQHSDRCPGRLTGREHFRPVLVR
jgi:hypothetical protein